MKLLSFPMLTFSWSTWIRGRSISNMILLFYIFFPPNPVKNIFLKSGVVISPLSSSMLSFMVQRMLLSTLLSILSSIILFTTLIFCNFTSGFSSYGARISLTYFSTMVDLRAVGRSSFDCLIISSNYSSKVSFLTSKLFLLLK